jgi:hypothetical protein
LEQQHLNPVAHGYVVCPKFGNRFFFDRDIQEQPRKNMEKPFWRGVSNFFLVKFARHQLSPGSFRLPGGFNFFAYVAATPKMG